MEKDVSAQGDIEIGDDTSINIVLDENDNVVGAIADEVIVATSSEGSVVDEIIDVLDANGDLVVEDEKVTFYDADAHVVAQSEEIRIPLEG